MQILNRILLISVIGVSIVGCSSGSDHADLRSYIGEVKQRPAGSIEPLPSFRPYEAFIYSSAAMRSPFDLPMDVERRVYASSSANVKPDFSREKEFLEDFALSSLQMVGSLKKGETLWALIKDGEGRIHLVTQGNYLGNNHGKVVEMSEAKLDLIEIVSDGLDGWLERPSVLALAEKE
ncbi:pilus assembly protein PilP [Teredinibacter haidensis]|uniref:pilus assembly protein PilP n=1 Tax=Teredinibacter haidensis TaxID=2731755 RepID=UPI000948F7CF|nr:pilus assembly protein PilP [Teredinibacter haidensis]